MFMTAHGRQYGSLEISPEGIMSCPLYDAHHNALDKSSLQRIGACS